MTMTKRDREDFDSNMNVMIESIAFLQDTYARTMPDGDILEESLTTGRMSDFLFEADEEEVKQSLQDAVDNATKLLDSLEKAGNDFPSVAIQQATAGLRDKLSKISMTGKTGGNFGLSDLLGIGAKEISHVGESIGVVNNSILNVVTGVSNMLKTANVKVEEVGDQTLKDLVKSKKLTAFKNEAELQKAVKDIVQGGVKQKAKGMLAKIVGFFKGSQPVNLDVNQFAIDILDAKLGALVQWTKSDSGQAAQSPEKMQQAVAGPIQTAVKSSGLSPKELQAAAAGSEGGAPSAARGGGKIKKAAARTGLIAALKGAAGGDEATAGKVADAMIASKDLADIFEESFRGRRYIHQMSLSSLLFEKIEFDTVQKVIKDDANVTDGAAIKSLAAAAMNYFKDQKLDVGDIPADAAKPAEGGTPEQNAEKATAAVESAANQADKQALGKTVLDIVKGFADPFKDNRAVVTTIRKLGAEISGALDTGSDSLSVELQNKFTEWFNSLSEEQKQAFGDDASDKVKEVADAIRKAVDDNLKMESRKRSYHSAIINESRWARLAGIREDRRR